MNRTVAPTGEEIILLTRAEYDSLVEDAGDAALLDAARHADAGAPSLPHHLMMAVLEGHLHPLAAGRKAAGMTQTVLAARAGVRVGTISNIEGGRIEPRFATVRALARALGLDAEDVMPEA